MTCSLENDIEAKEPEGYIEEEGYHFSFLYPQVTSTPQDLDLLQENKDFI